MKDYMIGYVMGTVLILGVGAFGGTFKKSNIYTKMQESNIVTEDFNKDGLEDIVFRDKETGKVVEAYIKTSDGHINLQEYTAHLTD